MNDVKALTDVELTEMWLEKVVGYKKVEGATELIRAIDYEMRERGAERVRTAWHEVSAKRGNCSVCGDCKPVAAYGGWCCAKALGGQEVAP